MDEKLQELVFSLESGLSTFLNEARLKNSSTPAVPSQALHPRQQSDDSGVDDSGNRISSILLTKLHHLADIIGEVSEELEPLSPSVSEHEDQEERNRLVVVLGPLGTERKTGITETRFDKAESIVYSRSSSSRSSFCQFHRKLRVEEVPLKDSHRPMARVCVSSQGEEEEGNLSEGHRWTRSRARMTHIGPMDYRDVYTSESSTEPLSTQDSCSSDEDSSETCAVRKSKSRNNRHSITAIDRVHPTKRHSVLLLPPVHHDHHSDTDSDETCLSPNSPPIDTPSSDLLGGFGRPGISDGLDAFDNEDVPAINGENEDHFELDNTLLCSTYDVVLSDLERASVSGLSEMEIEPESVVKDSTVEEMKDAENTRASFHSNREPSGIKTVLKDLEQLHSKISSSSKGTILSSTDYQTSRRRQRNAVSTNEEKQDTSHLGKNSETDSDSSKHGNRSNDSSSSSHGSDTHKKVTQPPTSNEGRNFNISLKVQRLSSDLVRFHVKNSKLLSHSPSDLITHHLESCKTIKSSPSPPPLTDVPDSPASGTGRLERPRDFDSDSILLEMDDTGQKIDECESVPARGVDDFESEGLANDLLDVYMDEFDEVNSGRLDSVASNETKPPLSNTMSDVFTSNDDCNDENELKSSENEMEMDQQLIKSPTKTSQFVQTPTRPLSLIQSSSLSQPSTRNSQTLKHNSKLQLSVSRRKPFLSASQPTKRLNNTLVTLSSDSDFDSAPLSLSQQYSSKLSRSLPSNMATFKKKKKKLLQCSDDEEKRFKSRVRLDFSTSTKSKSETVIASVEKSQPLAGEADVNISLSLKGKLGSTPGRKGKEKVIDQTRVPDVIDCASCGKGIQWRKKETHVHERLNVLVCEKCHKTYSKGSFSVVEGYEEYCTLCGDGGEIILCNFCNKAFCQSCIEHVSGKDHLDHLLSSADVEFTCYVCDSSPLEDKRQECRRVQALSKPQPFGLSHKYSSPASPPVRTSSSPLSPSWNNDDFDSKHSDTPEFTVKPKTETVAAPDESQEPLTGEAGADVSPNLKEKPVKKDKEKDVDEKKVPDVIECASCGKGIQWKKKAIHSHQRLQVLICEKCHNLYTSGSFYKKDDSEEYCSLCGEGGYLVMCDSDSCDKSICQPCILRVSGEDHLDYVLSSDDVPFVCYVCDTIPLEEKRQECINLCAFLKKSRRQIYKHKNKHKTCKSKEFVSESDVQSNHTDYHSGKDAKESSSCETDSVVSGASNSSGSSDQQGNGKKSTPNSSNKDSNASSKRSAQGDQQHSKEVRGNKRSPIGPGSANSSEGSSNDAYDDRSSPSISTDEISVSDASILEDGLSKNKKQKSKKKTEKHHSDANTPKKTKKKATSGSKLHRRLNHSSIRDFGDSDESDFEDFQPSQKRNKLKRFLSTTTNASSDTETSNGANSKHKPAKKRSKKSHLAEELSSGAESDAGPSRLTVLVNDGDAAMSSDSNGSFILEETVKSPSFSPVKYRTPVKASRPGASSSDSDLELSRTKSKNKLRKRALLSSSSLSSTSNAKEDKKPKIYKTRSKKKKSFSQLSGFGSSDDDFEDEDLSLRGPRLHRRNVKRSLLSSDSSDEEQQSDREGTKDETKGSQKDSEKEFTSPEKPTTPGKRRKKIRKMISDANLTEATKLAQREEAERKRRLKEKVNVTDDFNEVERLVLEYDADTKEVKIEVRDCLVTSVKPHQRQGIKFLYNSCIESLDRLKSGQGTGCILAHCMGLGKTLQVIALIDALLSCEESELSRVLVLCPVNVIHNWKNEFKHWIPFRYCDYHTFVLTETTTQQRLQKLRRWFQSGGVLLMGYQMYRNLASSKRIKKKKDREDFERFLLDPGADMVVCDEGHVMRNSKSHLSLILNRIKTRLRIVLTGTPLQNNLLEYYTMVNFVKPNLLGTLKEFTNRFVNPITNGQCRDSNPIDIRRMKQRAHVLHEKLKDIVQRRDYRVLADCLPPKHEFVLGVRMSPVQDQLYKHVLANRRKDIGHRDLFSTFSALSKVWNHPHVLKLDEERECERAERRMYMNGEDEDEDPTLGGFITFDSDEEGGDDLGNGSGGPKRKRGVRRKGSTSTGSNTSSRSSSMAPSSISRSTTPASKNDFIIISSGSEDEKTTRDPVPPLLVKTEEGGVITIQQSSGVGSVAQAGSVVMQKEQTPPPWYDSILPENSLDQPDLSGKLIFLMEVLNEAKKLKEKVLVFTQSLLTLDLIEEYLHKPENGDWTPGLHYYRLDGSIKADRRTTNMLAFNDKKNDRIRLYLISTKAGSLGVNLVAANRVIIFDACWNPSHDLQAIFRTYRYGQTKPIFVYRLLAQGTMEEKIYDRQILKQSLSMRVVDEKQIGRHYTTADLAELFSYTPAPPPAPPYKRPDVDMVLCTVLDRMQPKWIVDYHEHDSLLEHVFDEELSEEERKAAWENYKQQMADESRRYNLEALQNRLEDDQHGAYQVMHIVNSLSSCLQQTRIIQELQVKKHALDQTYANRGLVPPPVDQLEMQSLKKRERDGSQNLAHTISDVNKRIKEFNESAASRIPHYTEAIRNKSRELHDQLELYKQMTNHVPSSSAQLNVSAPTQSSVSALQATSLPGHATTPVHALSGQSSSSQAPLPVHR